MNTKQILAKHDVLYRLLLLVLFVVLVCIRMPNILHYGRFWAEEGTVFFVQASRMPWYEALFKSYGGYTNLAANAAGVLAYYLAPFKSAPYVSSILALVIQTFPAILLCISGQPLFRSRKALLAALLIVLVQPANQEIWLSSIGSQCFLNLCVGIILFLQTETQLAKRIFQYFVLLIAPLSGPASIFILPLYLVRAWIEKSRDRLLQACVLGLGAFIQLAFCYQKADRSMTMDWLLYLKIAFVKHFYLPLLGRVESSDYSAQMYFYSSNNVTDAQPVIIVVTVLIIYLLMLFKAKSVEAFWPFLIGAMLSSLSFVAALGDRGPMLLVDAGNRYTYAPQVLFELSLLVLAFTAKPPLIRKVSYWVMIWLIFVGCHEYFYSSKGFAEGPNWRAEVRRWKADPNYVLQLWPDQWTIKIRPENLRRQ